MSHAARGGSASAASRADCLMNGRLSWSCTAQVEAVWKLAYTPRPTTSRVQKERHQAFEVRPITSIKRMPFLTHVVCTHTQTDLANGSQVLLCMAQASNPAWWAWQTCWWRALLAVARRSCRHGAGDIIALAWPLARSHVYRPHTEAVYEWLLGRHNGEGTRSGALHARKAGSGTLPWAWLAARG